MNKILEKKQNGNLEKILGGPWAPKEPDSPEEQLRQAMSQHGLEPQKIILDGAIHRFPVGKSPDAGWYVGYSDRPQAGEFGNWKTGEQITWNADIGRELTTAEQIAQSRRVAEIREKRNQELEIKRNRAADIAENIWSQAGTASDEHPYLKRKGIKAHDLRITGDGRLIAPLYSSEGELRTIQYITSDGGKMYHKDGGAKNSFDILGMITTHCYIAEGYATGATIYETTGTPTVIAYSASNMVNAAGMLRGKYPTLSITIVADNDESGVGQSYAEQAAAKYTARVIVSPVESDVNDFAQQGGDLLTLLTEQKESRFKKNLIMPDMLIEEFKKTLQSSWIIKDIIPESSGLSMIYGPPGTYKSFIAIDMALSIAHNIEWHGKRIKKKDVLYVAAEGQMGVLKRFESWRQYHELEKLQNISILPMAAKLDNQIDVIDFVATIESLENQPEFVFFDTLARSMDGEENSKVDMAAVINTADMLRHKFSMQIMVIHHSGKDKTRGARGSNSLEGATDTLFRMDKGNEERTAYMTCERQKDNEPIDQMGFKMKKVDIDYTNIDGDRVNSLVPVFDPDAVPKKKEKQSNTQRSLLYFEKAWYASGADTADGCPYLTRSAWIDWFIKNDRRTESAAKQAVKSSSGGIAARLVENGFLKDHMSGYLLIDNSYASAMMMSKNSDEKK